MSKVRYQNKKLRKTWHNDNNAQQNVNNIKQKFSKPDNPKLVELLPKKSFQSIITIVTLVSYSTINCDKSYTCMTRNYFKKLISEEISFWNKFRCDWNFCCSVIEKNSPKAFLPFHSKSAIDAHFRNSNNDNNNNNNESKIDLKSNNSNTSNSGNNKSFGKYNS